MKFLDMINEKVKEEARKIYAAMDIRKGNVIVNEVTVLTELISRAGAEELVAAAMQLENMRAVMDSIIVADEDDPTEVIMESLLFFEVLNKLIVARFVDKVRKDMIKKTAN